MHLDKEELQIQRDLDKGIYIDAPKELEAQIMEMIKRRKKDAVLSIRVNKVDILKIREKAEKMGIRYQTYIAELIHAAAMGFWKPA